MCIEIQCRRRKRKTWLASSLQSYRCQMGLMLCSWQDYLGVKGLGQVLYHWALCGEFRFCLVPKSWMVTKLRGKDWCWHRHSVCQQLMSQQGMCPLGAQRGGDPNEIHICVYLIQSGDSLEPRSTPHSITISRSSAPFIHRSKISGNMLPLRWLKG